MDQRGIQYVLRDYARTPLTIDELMELIGSRKPKDSINVRSPSFRSLKIDLEVLDDARVTEFMLENQNIIQRPVLVIGTNRITGFDADIYETIGDRRNT